MQCPYCDKPDPKVSVLKDGNVIITGEERVSGLTQKADVSVECSHCHGHFLLQFQINPTGPMIDLS